MTEKIRRNSGLSSLKLRRDMRDAAFGRPAAAFFPGLGKARLEIGDDAFEAAGWPGAALLPLAIVVARHTIHLVLRLGRARAAIGAGRIAALSNDL